VKYLIIAAIIFFIYKSMPVKKIDSKNNNDETGYSDYEEID
jgi:hypothetical protein